MGEKITQYTSISTPNPSETSLIDVSEFLPNSTFDTRKMSLGQLIDYVNPIPYPCITVAINALNTGTATINVLKNTIDTTNPTLTKIGGGNYKVSHSSFSTNSTLCVIQSSGTSYTGGGQFFLYTQTTGEIMFYTMISGVADDTAMKQILITYYKLN